MSNVRRLFIITVIAKGLLGLTQLLTSAALYFGGLEKLPSIAQWLVQRELSEDPNDFLATRILSLANIAPSSDVFLHGLFRTAWPAMSRSTYT